LPRSIHAQKGFDYGLQRKDKTMEISARNQLKGQVKQIVRGSVMGEVIVDVGGQIVTSSITLSSIDRLALKVGDAVVVIVKATDVMIGK
jgi:molybdopterin-binding protein